VQLRRVYKNGNGLVFSIPPLMAAALKLTAGSQVTVAISNQQLIVQRAVILGAADLRTAGDPKEFSRE
jgi:antitoxin component of MazEF toxin-antitoxin module